jgi:hypothetical protein
MPKAVRFAARGLLVVVALGLALLFATLTPVDSTPYFTTLHYSNTVGRLRTALAAQPVRTGALRAGFGQARLTPVPQAAEDNPGLGRFRAIPLAGYGNRRGRPATGVHDELWAKAVALDVDGRRLVLLSADLLIQPREITGVVAEQLARDPGLRRDQLLFGATHTHSSLGGWGEGLVAEAFAGPFQPGVRQWLTQQMVAAARAAVADLKPARFAHQVVPQPGRVRNRVVGARGQVDPELGLVALHQDDGVTAVLAAFAAHATLVSGDNFAFSGDYPGAWQRVVESRTNTLALFFAGGVGSHSAAAPGNGFAGAEAFGGQLAAATLAALPTLAFTNRIAFAAVGVDVDLPEPHVRLTDSWRLRPTLARRLLHFAGPTYFQAVRIGDLLWFAAPCDFSGELALGLKESARARGADALVTSFNGDYIGYVIPARYYHLAGYEPRTMSFFGPTIPDYFLDLARTFEDGLKPAPNR